MNLKHRLFLTTYGGYLSTANYCDRESDLWMPLYDPETDSITIRNGDMPDLALDVWYEESMMYDPTYPSTHLFFERGFIPGLYSVRSNFTGLYLSFSDFGYTLSTTEINQDSSFVWIRTTEDYYTYDEFVDEYLS